MKFFKWAKDGGPESTVSGFFFIEIKSLFSIALLKFEGASRNAYHEHAFNSISWLIWGHLAEYDEVSRFAKNAWHPNVYFPGDIIRTRRSTFHRVESTGTSWVLTFRGPWSKTWREYTPEGGYRTLTHGRKEAV